MAIRYKLREDYKDGDLLHGRDVNKITHRVNELDDKVISIDDKADLTALTEYQVATEAALQGKQDVLTAGDNITIQNNVISANVPSEIDDSRVSTAYTYSSSKIAELVGGAGFDTVVVQELPASGDPKTIYLVPKEESSTNNVYDEYIYSAGAWEKIGDTEIDLTPYATKEYVDTLHGESILSGSNNVEISENVVRAKGYAYNQKWNIFLGNTVEELETNTFTNNGHVILGKGTNNRIKGESQIIFGNANTASTIYSSYSVVFGDENRLADDAFIYGSLNGTNGAGVFIAGQGNSVAADNSVAIGTRLRTSHKNEFAIGLGNVTHKTNQGTEYTGLSGDTLLSIGNGRIDAKNAFELMEDGTLYIEGIGNYDGTQIASGNNNVKSLQMVVSGIYDSLSTKQDTLTAGTNITINNGVISAQQPDLSPYALASEVQSAISQVEESKQDKLSAGTNITIQNNVISAQQPDLSPYALSADVTTELAKKTDSTAFTAYTASTAQLVNGMAHEIDENASAITALQSSKQDVLSAGTGINIQNNVISLVGTPALIDDTSSGSTDSTWSSEKINEVIEAKVAAAIQQLQISLINLT